MNRTVNDPRLNLWRNKMVVGAVLYLRALSQDLYEMGGALWELVKNALCACMTESGVWQFAGTHVELSLVRNHPLCHNDLALVCMDRGRGFTDPDIERFLCIGGNDLHQSGRHGGGSQKQMGRFAYLMLNRHIAEATETKDIRTGFYILTRTSTSGPVTMVTVTPETIREGFDPKLIGEDASELGAYRGIKGSFSIIVIPHSVFKTIEEITEALVWRLPGKRNLAVKIMVGGKQLLAPPLARETITVGNIEAFLERPEKASTDSGIWLTDAASGLRCAFAPAMGMKLPYPLARHDLVGDIFIRNLLPNQHTSRHGLRSKYLQSKEWADVYDQLSFKVAPFAKELLGDSDLISSSEPRAKMLHDFVDLFRSVWGESTLQQGDLMGIPPKIRKPPTELPPRKPRTESDGEPNGGGGGHRETKPRAIGTRIGDKEYYFASYPTADPLTYAEVGADKRSILINPNYAIHIQSQVAEREHCLLRLLTAVAIHEHHDSVEADRRAAQLRAELTTGGKAKK